MEQCIVCGREGYIFPVKQNGKTLYHGECGNCHATTRMEQTEDQAIASWNYGHVMNIHSQLENKQYSWLVQKTIDKLYNILCHSKRTYCKDEKLQAGHLANIIVMCQEHFDNVIRKWCDGWNIADIVTMRSVAVGKFVDEHVNYSKAYKK